MRREMVTEAVRRPLPPSEAVPQQQVSQASPAARQPPLLRLADPCCGARTARPPAPEGRRAAGPCGGNQIK